MRAPDRSNAIGRAVVLVSENLSVDNLFGCLYVPQTDPDVRQP